MMLKSTISLTILLFLMGGSRKFTMGAPQPAVPVTELKEIVPNVYTYASFGEPFSLFSMFIVTRTGVIVIEPFNTQHSKDLLAAIRNVTQAPIRLLLISHNHWDHANGGKVFADVGAKVMAHKEAVEWMEANPHPDLYIPNKSWRGNFKQICMGGETLELHFFGINHGIGTTVFLYKSPNQPKDNVMFVADIVTPRSVIFGMAPDSNLKEVERTYREVVKLPADRVIFTHNSRNLKGTMNDIQLLLNYVVALREAVDKKLAEGMNPFTIPDTLTLPEFKDFDNYEQNLPLNALKLILERFIGPYPWRKI